MTVPFEYFNLPDEMLDLNPIAEDLMQDVDTIINDAKAAGAVVVEEATMAYMYDRKSYVALDDFAGPRNKSYGYADDDLVIQVTMRIRNPQALDAVQALKSTLVQRKLTADRAKLAAEVARLQIVKEEAEKELHKKIDELSKMNVQ